MTGLIFNSEIVYFGLVVVIFTLGFIMFSNHAYFLLAAGTISAAFQGGLWIPSFNTDFYLSFIIFSILLVYSYVNPKSNNGIRYNNKVMIFAWLGVFLFSIFAITKALDVSKARQAIILFSIDLVIFFAIWRTVRTPKDVQFFIACLIAALIVQSMIGMLQYKIPLFKIGIIDQVLAEGKTKWYRAKGTFYHPNGFGMYIMIMLPIAYRGLINAYMQKNIKWRFYCIVGLTFGIVALLASFNRGSWAGLFVGFFIMCMVDFFRRKKKITKVLSNLIVAAFIFGTIISIKFAPVVLERIYGADADEQVENRSSQMVEATELIKQNPFIGVGYGNDLFYAAQIFVHNLYLLIAAEAGIPGLIFFLWFLIELFRETWRTSGSQIIYCANYSRGFIASLIGFCISSWVGPDFWIHYGVQSYFWLLVSLVFVVGRLDRNLIYKQKMMQKRQRETVAHNNIPVLMSTSGYPK